ncbi:MAG: hypothetical protein WAT72_00035 [Microgenomates group bacterium]|jgi:hypothetical protein|nr:MAG: hypothetical protein IPH70_02800 [Candidatus Roizmanbacteria bacterium]
MTIERRRQIRVHSGIERDWTVPIPFTKRKIEEGKVLAFREESPAVASFFGETIDVGTTTHFYEVVVLDPESLGIKKTETLTPTVAFLDTMEDLSTEGLKPRQVVDLSGVIAGHKINGIAFPTNRRLQTVFRYKPSK